MHKTESQTYRDELKQLLAKDLVFVVGMPKSGTTWVQTLIDSHPQAICKGESHFVDIFYLELSRQLNQYNKAVTQQGGIVAHLKGYGGHVDTLSYQMEDANYLLVIAIAMMFSKWLGKEGVSVLGEKTPDNIGYMPLLAAIFPNAKFIHVIRDPRDCAISSWFFQTSNLDRNKALKQTFEEHVLAFARFWDHNIGQGRKAGIELDQRYIELFYEDLASNLDAQIRKAAYFLDLDTSAGTIDQCAKCSTFERQSGGRKPGHEDRKSFVRKGIAGDWKNHLSDELNNEFLSIAGSNMRRFGYLRDWSATSG